MTRAHAPRQVLVGAGATEVEPKGFFILLGSVVLSGLNGVIIQAGFSRIAVSETEAPILFANLV